eukprot:scaffold15497_cov117-Cylindrotheca_fusiformis.AAC.12
MQFAMILSITCRQRTIAFQSNSVLGRAYCVRSNNNSYGTTTTTTTTATTTQILQSTTSQISLDRTAQRQIDQFQGWAGSCDVQADYGFCLQGQLLIDGTIEDYFAATATGAPEGARVLYVPGEMILSSLRIAQEYAGYVDASLQLLTEMDMQHLHKHFHLFLRILIEYEQGEESPYFPWLDALPRMWNTAVSMGKNEI